MTIWPDRPPTEREHLVVAAMQSADDAIVTIAFDGTITNWNAGADQLFGYSTWEAIGTSISIIVPDDRKEEMSDGLARIARGEKGRSFGERGNGTRNYRHRAGRVYSDGR
jgi:PAS domain S-box-containing protein